ncbi:discoidin domain-containing protein [Microbacterium sp. VKM Ac-2923]|uniref:discoidin domain-containing protein n=1 Tax=Microbacterium sp. VKM Ac-2923 TaxID=2929476 RepID=UPI001FB41EF2|nr:discoidin domain-containing protein [Microbacterium sp. VKM Ac-2923]MCJ1708828.1 discoidin domain-containing protein [Microbacterium sp. VKM Ac-2923]
MTHARRRSHWFRYAVATAAASALIWGAVVPAASAAGRDDAATWAGNVANPYGGTDYFVDATTGVDTASGTARDQAWKSLARVNSTTFQPGDRILLKGGETWADQQLWPKGSGTTGKPIVIDAYGDAAAGLPYIRTNGKVTSPFSANGLKNPDTVGLTGAVNLRNQEYVHIANLELSNDDDFATDITSGSFVRDGVSVSINADKLAPGADTVMDGIRISNLDVHNIDGPSSWQRIHYGGVNFQVFGSQQWTAYGKGGYHFRDIRIENNTFTEVELHAVQFAFNWFGDAQGRVDETGKFHEGWEQLWVRDQDFYSRDVYIGHNYAESIGQGPYQFANTQRLLAEYNEANGWLERYRQVSAGLYLWAGADSTMRFNEIYGGPANEYDATPWDLEFTNFNVTYEYNYSHDNQGGWMSYMGNSSNSIARYNLSVNDNGVIWKNMLSTNYSPTYVSNNVFVYDGSKLHQFHDEVLKSRVYFFNNVFYNTSTTPTTWYRKDGALDLGVFSNNAYFETGGVASPQQPKDDAAITADPQFTGKVADYARNAGVENIRQSAGLFTLKDTSPLIDKGRYNERIGTTDFFGSPNYRGSAPDIGLFEATRGAVVTAPVDTNPIENVGVDTRTNLALGKSAVASSTHPHNNFALKAANLVDGDASTRWAAADNATYPLTIDIDFGASTRFDEVDLSEFTDSGTDARIAAFSLQRWDAATNSWVTFASGDGVGTSKVVRFDAQTSSKLRLSIAGIKAGQIYAPTMREIKVFNNGTVQTNPVVTPAAGFYDRNASQASSARNTVSYRVDLGGDTVRSLGYVTTSGALVGSLDAADYTVSDDAGTKVYTLTPAFFADKELGTSGIVFDFASNKTTRVSIEIGDTTALEKALATAAAVAPGTSAAHVALQTQKQAAQSVLDAANRTRAGSGNDTVTQTAIANATTALTAAIAAVNPLSVEATASTRKLAGKAYVTVTAVNRSTVPVLIDITTAYGKKSFATVQPGQKVSVSINSTKASIPAGAATVTATATVNGKKVSTSVQASYSAQN